VTKEMFRLKPGAHELARGQPCRRVGYCRDIHHSRFFSSSVEILVHPLSIKPAHLLVGSPQLRCLVDINFTRLLGIGLAELLPDFGAFNTTHKHSPLAGEIGRAVQTQASCQKKFVGVQEAGVRILAQIKSITLPIHLETVGFVGE